MSPGVGVMASTYRVVGGGGGVTVDDIEVHTGQVPTSPGTASVTITTSLVSTDMVVVALMKSSTTGTPGLSGLGTWTNLQAGTGSRDHYLWTTTGVTGGGSFTISVGSNNGDYVVYVLRRSDGAAVTAFGSNRFDSAFIAANTQVSVTDISSATSGMFAIGVASPQGGTLTFPHANMLPSSGWNTDLNGSNSIVRFVSQTLASNSTVRVAASSTSATSWAMLAGVFQ